MKKVRRFPYERIPAFIIYVMAAVCIVGCFTAGKHCFFMGIVYYIFGMMIDPKSDLYDKK